MLIYWRGTDWKRAQLLRFADALMNVLAEEFLSASGRDPQFWHTATGFRRQGAIWVCLWWTISEPWSARCVAVKPRRNSGLTGIYWHIVSSTVYRKDIQMNNDVFPCFFLSFFLCFFLIGVFSGDWLPFLHMGETASGISKTLWRVNQGHMVQPAVIISAMWLHKKQRYIYIYI